MNYIRNCLVLCVLLSAGCAGEFGDESEFPEEEVGSVDQALIVEWDIVCADPGTTVWYTHARVRGQNVGNSAAGGTCEFPIGCVTSYHVCSSAGCGLDHPVAWPGDDICWNNV